MAAPKSSPARIAANRANARKSTGPRTEAGKARSRANAVKHGLTGAGVALPGEDAAAIEAEFLQAQEEFAPTTLAGMRLVRDVAAIWVRQDRALGSRRRSSKLAPAAPRATSTRRDPTAPTGCSTPSRPTRGPIAGRCWPCPRGSTGSSMG